jgi:hypothetical protein
VVVRPLRSVHPFIGLTLRALHGGGSSLPVLTLQIAILTEPKRAAGGYLPIIVCMTGRGDLVATRCPQRRRRATAQHSPYAAINVKRRPRRDLSSRRCWFSCREVGSKAHSGVISAAALASSAGPGGRNRLRAAARAASLDTTFSAMGSGADG